MRAAMRWTGGVTRTLAVGAALFATSCAPGASLSTCANVPDSVVEMLNQRLTADGTLRNARAVVSEKSGMAYVSVELHLAEDDDEEKGDVLTFTASEIEGPDFLAVDENARTETSWPHASVDMRVDGAVESRGCAYAARGPIEDEDDVNDLLDQYNR